VDPIVNISAYRFVAVAEPVVLRDRLFQAAERLGLKGTVLIAEEGINLFLAGSAGAIARWQVFLEEDDRLAGMEFKSSISDAVPFRRLKVKVKPEIIRMNQPTIRPHAGRAPAVATSTLVRWMARGADDDGRPLRLLDTRNAFEVDAGRFAGALDWRLQRFSDFPTALVREIDGLRDQAVVAYCTGGIRCEKAVLLMRERGLATAHQLEGGILGWFEATAGRAPGWQGQCVVFDERGALDPTLTQVPVDAMR
jgi:UPF0176 protein